MAKCAGPGRSQEVDLKVLNRYSTSYSIDGKKYEMKLAPRIPRPIVSSPDTYPPPFKPIAVEIDPVKPEITGDAPWGYEAMMAMGPA